MNKNVILYKGGEAMTIKHRFT